MALKLFCDICDAQIESLPKIIKLGEGKSSLKTFDVCDSCWEELNSWFSEEMRSKNNELFR